MTRLFVVVGPYMYVLAVLAVVIVVLTVKKAIALFAESGAAHPRQSARDLDAILFWGCISAVLGFLNQFSGTYLSLTIIREAGLVHPGLVAEGIAVSLIPTVFGLIIFAASAIAWFGLKFRANRSSL